MAGLAVGGDGQAMAPRAAVAGELAVGGEEPLRVARILEPPPPLLPLGVLAVHSIRTENLVLSARSCERIMPD